MDDYEVCQICGHQYPQGHPCLTCHSKGVKGKVVDGEIIAEYVKVLRLHKNDILIYKGYADESMVKFLMNHPTIVQKNISIMFLDDNSELFILRDR